MIPYYVTIKTKNYDGFSADTLSDVHIILFGDKGNSGEWLKVRKLEMRDRFTGLMTSTVRYMSIGILLDDDIYHFIFHLF